MSKKSAFQGLAFLGFIVAIVIGAIVMFIFEKIQTIHQSNPLIIPFVIVCLLILFIAFKLAETYSENVSLKRQNIPIEEAESVLNQAKENLNSIKQEVAELNIIKSDLDISQTGFYDFRYDFEDSDRYAQELESLKDKEKQLLKQNEAITWSDSSASDLNKKSQGIAKRLEKLSLMAFYGEFDVLLTKIKYSNVEAYIEKVDKIAKSIENLLKDNNGEFTREFLKLKKEEISLVYEYQELKQKEKEEQRLIKEQMKEEEKAQREAQKAQEDAEKEEKTYEKALAKARLDLAKQKDENKEVYANKIKELEMKLSEAQAQKERAKSQAQLTRRGHVYVISNLGSFGENVYKIGMTRRLDPHDRVKELGDASVPFEFDIHAMIFSEDAPTLEKQLHNFLHDKRINKINEKKEFFKVSMNEIEDACTTHCKGELKLTKIAEAKEFNLTMAKLKALA